MEKLRIPYAQLVETFEAILLEHGFTRERAHLSATLFAKASLDGVASHGLNRFPTYIKLIRKGFIQEDAAPEPIGSFGLFERWDGNKGPGNLNAYHCMERAIALASAHGMGCIALRNTNHWMRGGNYGWQAVEEGCIGICFTNTKPNLPAWGGSEPRLGNNPLVVAVPRKKGPLVLDMALSQFSYGKMRTYLRDQQELPYAGGFDAAGALTKDPQPIIEKELGLPIGLWKGAGLSLMLDVLAALLSEGQATHRVGEQEEETGISQLFLCFNTAKLGIAEYPEEKLDAIVEHLKASATFESLEVRYPGERTLQTRMNNLKKGVPVEMAKWQKALDLLKQAQENGKNNPDVSK